MATLTAVDKDDNRASVYSGPIFDADTHIWETPDAFTKYFPADLKADWGVEAKKGPDGQFAFYVGSRKVEISADHLDENGKVPAPGKLHEWLRAMKEGKADIDLKVDKTPDMPHREITLRRGESVRRRRTGL